MATSHSTGRSLSNCRTEQRVSAEKAFEGVIMFNTAQTSSRTHAGEVTVQNVGLSYQKDKEAAVKDVSFKIGKGEFVFLVGPSGSGKSSLMRLLLKETAPTSGNISVSGVDLKKLPGRRVHEHRQRVGAVFQDFRLLPNKSAKDNIAFALQVLGKEKGVDELVAQALNIVGLSGKEDRLPGELSGGEQQRVAVARALVNHPEVILADEPTGNLDPHTGEGIMRLLETVAETGTTVIVATHDAGMVSSMQKRVLEMRDGLLVRDEKEGKYHL